MAWGKWMRLCLVWWIDGVGVILGNVLFCGGGVKLGVFLVVGGRHRHKPLGHAVNTSRQLLLDIMLLDNRSCVILISHILVAVQCLIRGSCHDHCPNIYVPVKAYKLCTNVLFVTAPEIYAGALLGFSSWSLFRYQ